MSKKEKVELTNICLIYKEDRILVIDRKKNDWPGLTFPGGHVKEGENINDSIIREVKEETGLSIKKPILCGIEEYKPNKGYDRYLVFFYKTNNFKGKIKSSNEGEVYWLKKDEFLKSKKLSNDLDIYYKIMNSDNLSELYYYKVDKKWKKKVV